MKLSILTAGLILICFSLLCPQYLCAQNYGPVNCSINASSKRSLTRSSHERSWFGNVFTPSGDIHVLVIFVGFNSATSADDLPAQGWPHDDLPTWAKGDDNMLLNKDVANIGSHENLSYWYNEMSNGQFILTGEVFPKQTNKAKPNHKNSITITPLVVF